MLNNVTISLTISSID